MPSKDFEMAPAACGGGIMARKREMDNLAKDAAAALAAGMSYGKWKAMQGETRIKKPDELPDGWYICKNCGKPFKPGKYNGRKIYCELNCQREAARKRQKSEE
jgi:hypothetical protein